jgi:hypothetical protein
VKPCVQTPGLQKKKKKPKINLLSKLIFFFEKEEMSPELYSS